MYSELIRWFENHLQPCFWKKHFGVECFGCGMQRSFVELLKGNIIESLKLYPALIPIIFLFSFLFLHVIFKYKNGAFILKISFIFTIIIIVTNFIFKLIYSNNL
ncbi:MAG: hypothetical protein A2046_02280 [Bacteroidetes bacterium GWA2_30_7]|nr:MAG: hypothetical protein A2046_02280 [Bacteroidetes bacterium GWA2_30_7]